MIETSEIISMECLFRFGKSLNARQVDLIIPPEYEAYVSDCVAADKRIKQLIHKVTIKRTERRGGNPIWVISRAK